MPIPETPLARVSVADATHTGILTTDPDTRLTVVAHLMAERGVHAIAVTDADYARRPLEFVTALDICAAASTDGRIASEVASPLRAIRSDRPVEDAARLMVQDGVEHLLVVDPSSGHAEGIISSLDIAAVYGRRAPV
ncbi:MAG TPA: CBS domain-containing protein [Solirubrobacteraceae bacterium]|nr:CBS domain-containing protein [Solirubrobacteraceae bacterium]